MKNTHREYALLLEFLETNQLKLDYYEGSYYDAAQFTLPEWILMKAEYSDYNEDEIYWMPLSLGKQLISIKGRLEPAEITDLIRRGTMALQIKSGYLEESTFLELLEEYYIKDDKEVKR